jgi:hypothetical protein
MRSVAGGHYILWLERRRSAHGDSLLANGKMRTAGDHPIPSERLASLFEFADQRHLAQPLEQGIDWQLI